MSGRLTTVEAKVGQWWQVFEAVRAELTPEAMRTILAQMSEVEGISQLASYMQLASQVMANDREAARVAAMLVGQNVRPPEGSDIE